MSAARIAYELAIRSLWCEMTEQRRVQSRIAVAACGEDKGERERERDRETERQRERDRQTDRHAHTQREREGERQTDTERERERERQTDRQTDRQREKERERGEGEKERESRAELRAVCSVMIEKRMVGSASNEAVGCFLPNEVPVSEQRKLNLCICPLVRPGCHELESLLARTNTEIGLHAQ
eukprot:4726311-Pleurochrysis_carterae.AAC.1